MSGEPRCRCQGSGEHGCRCQVSLDSHVLPHVSQKKLGASQTNLASKIWEPLKALECHALIWKHPWITRNFFGRFENLEDLVLEEASKNLGATRKS